MKRLFMCVVCLFMLFGCASLNTSVFDNDFNAIKIAQYMNSFSTITTSATSDGMPLRNAIGTCFDIGRGYVLAETHTTKYQDFKYERMPFGNIAIPITPKGYKFSIDGEPAVLIGRHEDISVFKRSIRRPHKEIFKWGDSDKLSIGDNLFVIGDSFLRGNNFKRGIVSLLDLSKYDYNGKHMGNIIYKDIRKITFLVTIPINGGDSGSPVFAIKNGNYSIVGIIYAAMRNGQGMNMAYKSNYVLENIAKTINDHESKDKSSNILPSAPNKNIEGQK